jgi:hypothetical protein
LWADFEKALACIGS